MAPNTNRRDRIEIHLLHQLGWKQQDIAEYLGLTKRQVQYAICQPTTPRKQPGQLKIPDSPKHCRLVEFITTNSKTRRMPCSELLKALEWDVYKDIIQTALEQEGYGRRISRGKFFLTEKTDGGQIEVGTGTFAMDNRTMV